MECKADVEQVVATIFETMLGLPVEPYPMTWERPQDLVTAVVSFAGAWSGALVLECTSRQARLFAQRILSIDPPTMVNEDVKDALGELVNVLAGNLKSLLPHGVVISMPSMNLNGDFAKLVWRVSFWCMDEAFAVTLCA